MTPHRAWEARGFGPDLLPIIPPLVALSATTKVHPASRGKVPGVLEHGNWHGLLGWRGTVATGTSLDAWGIMGAGVGLQCGRWIGCDIDVRQAIAATLLRELAVQTMGAGVPRIGAAPKIMLLYAAAPGERITKRRTEFRLPGDAEGDKPHAVEILGAGQFFVIEGTHPGTMQPYMWPEGMPAAFEVVAVTNAMIDAYMAGVAEAVVTDLGGTVTASTPGPAGGNRDAVAQAGLLAPSPELLAEALAALPNTGDRDTWIKVGHAIKAAGGDWEQWAEWSDRWDGEPEDPEMLQRRWDGFTPPFSTGWPQIERLARAAGWLGGVAHDYGGLDLAALTASAPKQHASAEADGSGTVQGAMFARYVWVKSLERIGDTLTGEVLTRGQFNAQLAEVGPPHDSRRCAWAVFLADKERCRHVVAATYRPAAPALVEERGRGLCLNEWRGDGVAPAAGPVTDADVAPFLALAARLYPDPAMCAMVLDWMALVAQNPGVKPPFGMVLGGHQGIGKDSLLLPLASLIGPGNTRHITMRDVLGGQTWYLAKCGLLIVQEVHSFNRTEVADLFKPLLANLPDTVVVNIKFVPQYEVPNIAACVMMTNRRDALAIDRDDRRHMVAWSPHPDLNQMGEAERATADRGFSALHVWYGRGGHGLTARWLLSRDVTAFAALKRAPWTEGKEEMRQAARSEAAEAIEEAVADWPDLVSPADLALRLSAGRLGKALTGKAVAVVLRAMGAEPVTRGPVVVPQTGTVGSVTKLRVWALRDVARYAAMPDAAIGRQFGEAWGATKQDIEVAFPLKGVG